MLKTMWIQRKSVRVKPRFTRFAVSADWFMTSLPDLDFNRFFSGPWTHAFLSCRPALPFRHVHPEQRCVLGVQSLKPGELHRVWAHPASNRLAAKKVIEHIEAYVPPGRAHCDEAAIDAGPQRQARAAPNRLEFPAHIVATPLILKRLGCVRPRHDGLGDMWPRCSDRGELHSVSNCTQALIGVKRSPLAQMHRVRQCPPDFFRRVAQLSDENECPVLSFFLAHLRPAGWPRDVLCVTSHLLLRSVSALPTRELRELNQIPARVFQHCNRRAGHLGGRHREFGAAGLDLLVVALDVVGEEHSRGLVLLKHRLLIRFCYRVVVERQLQLSTLRFLSRGHGQPAIGPLTEIGLLGKSQYLGIEAQGLVLIVHIHTSQFDLHWVSPLSLSRLEPPWAFFVFLFVAAAGSIRSR